MFTIGLTLVVISTFNWLFLLGLGAKPSLLGLTSLSSIILEAPMFFFSRTVLDKLGIPGTILLAQFALAIRVFAYSLLTPNTVSFVLLIEMLHGICFATAWSAGVKLALSIAPPGREATSQGILNAVFSGLGPAVGCTLGGTLYDGYGPQMMFRVLGLLNIVGAVLFGGMIWVRARLEAQKTAGQVIERYEPVFDMATLPELSIDSSLPPRKPPRDRTPRTPIAQSALFSIGSESSRLGSIGSLDSKKIDGENEGSEKGSQRTVTAPGSVHSSRSVLIQRAQSASLGASLGGSVQALPMSVIKSPRVSQAEAVSGSLSNLQSTQTGETIGIGKREVAHAQ